MVKGGLAIVTQTEVTPWPFRAADFPSLESGSLGLHKKEKPGQMLWVFLAVL